MAWDSQSDPTSTTNDGQSELSLPDQHVPVVPLCSGNLDVASVLNFMGYLYRLQAKYADAERAYERSLRIAEGTQGSERVL